MTEQTFYVVWCPEHGLPRQRHDTRDRAVIEAKRLARMNPGSTFIVMAAVSAVKVRDPVEEVEYDDIPF